jgi:hypothetical protein
MKKREDVLLAKKNSKKFLHASIKREQKVAQAIDQFVRRKNQIAPGA